MRRQWAERLVIVIAALASLATSPGWWVVQATLPPPPPDKAMAVMVEASREPEVWIEDGRGGQKRLAPTVAARSPGAPAATPTWPGEGRYLVPAGARLQRVEIRERCKLKLCGGKCKPPDTEYVRVTSATAVDAWTAQARSSPVTTVLDTSKPLPRYRAVIKSSRLPVTFEVEGAPDGFTPSIWPGASGHLTELRVAWFASNPQAPPATVTWTARATIQGECPGPAACAVPEGEAVQIMAVEEEAPDAR
jgi:hypothetical protein